MIKKIISQTKSLLSKKSVEVLPKPSVPNPRDSDIYLVSYPKSGNTWMRYLLAYAIWPAISEVDLFDMASLIPSFGIEHDWQVMLNPESPCNKLKHRIIKEHFSYNVAAKQYARRVIYITRDGRDAMVSYWHFCNQQSGTTVSFSNFIKESATHPWGQWNAHVLGWLNAPIDGKLILRYEDMLEDTVLCLRKALEFSEIQVSESDIKKAVQRASFESMRKLEKTKGFNLEQIRNVEFVRKGKKGSWKEAFGPEDMELFNKYHGGAIPELDYVW